VKIESALLLALLIAGCISDAPQADTSQPSPTYAGADYLVYENAAKHISLRYPKDWSYTEGTGDEIVSLSDKNEKFSGVVTVRAKDITTPYIPTDGEFMESMTAYGAEYITGYDMLEANKTTLNSYPAYRHRYTTRVDNMSFQVVEYYILTNTTEYQLSYIQMEKAYGVYEPTIEGIINSFRMSEGA
jgi:hypothetical protein